MEENRLALVIQNPTQGNFLKRIEWNKEEFEALVASVMEQYAGMVFTEDQMKDAKQERARLNAMRKAISDRRVQVKNEVMAPYNTFEAEVKEVVALIDKPIAEIDRQIKAFEERQKAEKRDAIYQHFLQQTEGLNGVLDFDLVFDKRYLNTTVTLARAKQDVTDKVQKVIRDLNTIGEIEPEYQLHVMAVYLKTLDISKALGEMNRLRELKRIEQERTERESAAREIKQKEEEDVQHPESTPKPIPAKEVPTANNSPVQDEPVAKDPFIIQPKPKRYKASFTVYGSRDQIMAVRQFMLDNNIQFGKAEQK